jgi:FAD/FMN-containing dehydrogenase
MTKLRVRSALSYLRPVEEMLRTMKKFVFNYRELLDAHSFKQKLNSLLEELMSGDEPLINTGVVSQSPTQFGQLWGLREGITEAVSKEGKAYKYDISIPLASFKEVVDTTRDHLQKQGLMHEDAVKHVLGYGHVGDGKHTRSSCELTSHCFA